MNIKIPAFSESYYSQNDTNDTTRVYNFSDADVKLYDSYCNLFESQNFVKQEEKKNMLKSYASFSNNDYGIFINYYTNLNELSIIIEKSCNYFSYSDIPGNKTVSPQITQVGLADYGMSYAIRLSDGRFIVIDGGRELKPDAIALYETLKKGSPYKKPVIAAWIMTHAHCDHYRCFNLFTEMYFENVIVEKFFLNFPNADSLTDVAFAARRPEIKDDFCFENSEDSKHVKLMYKNIEKYNAKIFIPHTGQTYIIGDAVCEFLSTPEDVIHITNLVNPQSLVFKMELGGQTILWTGDASFSDSRLSEKYSELLKADILQYPHHGFLSGASKGQIECFDKIKPSLCFLPVSEYNAYTAICIYKEGTRYFMENSGVDEIITGPESHTITLPYTPPPRKKDELNKKVKNGLKCSGSDTWFFTNLNTSNKDDFIYTIVNTTASEAKVEIELYFEDRLKKITKILAIIPSGCLKQICITDEKDVIKNSEYFNWNSLNVIEIPENAPFAVRFLSNQPVVVSHKNHNASYTK